MRRVLKGQWKSIADCTCCGDEARLLQSDFDQKAAPGAREEMEESPEDAGLDFAEVGPQIQRAI